MTQNNIPRQWECWTIIEKGATPGPNSSGGRLYMKEFGAQFALHSIDSVCRGRFEIVKVRAIEMVEGAETLQNNMPNVVHVVNRSKDGVVRVRGA